MINLVYKTANGQIHSFTDGLMAFGIGAAAGALGAATGGIAFAAAGGAAGGIGGFLAGAAAGGAGSAASMAVQSGGNTLYFGDPFISPEDFALGVLGGTITGGIGNGAIAAMKGNNFWTGKDVKFGRGRFSFNNTPTRPAPEMKVLEAPKLVSDTPKGLTNEQLVQKAATKAIGGKGAVAGTAKHEYATNLLERDQKMHRDRGL